MIWAKIVNNEIMQTHDEDPSGLWHPDQIAKNDLPGYWEQVPDHVNVGWKFKNDEWISGGQWLEEHIAENPTPPPGPPFADWSNYVVKDNGNTVKLGFHATPNGIWDTYSWVINGEEYGQEEFVEIEFVKQATKVVISVVLTVTGPGGTVTSEHKDPVEIQAKPLSLVPVEIPTV
jgi:hypothetical protein